MPRPQDWHDVDRFTQREAVREPIRGRMIRLARFLDENEGVEADYQRESTAPRVSFGAKLRTMGWPSLWFVGYRPELDLPDLVVLPANAGWRRLPQRVLTAFREGLSAGRFPMDRIGARICLDEVNHNMCGALETGTLLAVRATRATKLVGETNGGLTARGSANV